jgi:phosphohistidine phosphatase SixA
MKTPHLLLALAFISVFASCKNTEESKFQFEIPEGKDLQKTTYYFVRHAEKDTLDPEDKDPHLTDEGLRRANYLAIYFEDKNLDLFYSTDFNRTIQTLIPTIHHYKGDIISYEAKSNDTLFSEKFWKDTYGKNVLVVGHSNTSPRFVNEILLEEKYKELDESNYDVFFKVEIDKELNIKDSLITRTVPENFSYNQVQQE